MFQARRVWVFLLITLILTGAGCRSKKEGPVLARFDSEVITRDEFAEKLQGLPKEIQSLAYRHKKDFAEEMINERYLLREAEKRQIDRMPDVKALLKVSHNAPGPPPPLGLTKPPTK